MEAIQLWDQSISFGLQNIHNPFLDFIMPIISLISNEGIIWMVFGAALCIPRRYRKYGIMVFFAIGLSFIVGSVILKPLIARPRPCDLFPDVPLLTEKPDGFSFPIRAYHCLLRRSRRHLDGQLEIWHSCHGLSRPGGILPDLSLRPLPHRCFGWCSIGNPLCHRHGFAVPTGSVPVPSNPWRQTREASRQAL